MNYADCKPGDVIPVIIEGKVYETVIDERGVQRFRKNTVLEYMFNHDATGKQIDHDKRGEMGTMMLNLNTLAVAFQRGKFDKREYMEIVMQGYSVSSFLDLHDFAGYTVSNPIWDDGAEFKIENPWKEVFG